MVAIKDMLDGQTVIRADGRKVDELRPVRITRHFTDVPEGSVLVECGNTRVMCTATFTAGVPRWRKDSGLGWVTAEYAMLPRATADRTDRESVRGKIGGRTHEISRLIGRCLRGVVDMKALGENQVQIDCDVLQADGGTRTASITGAYVALVDAMRWAEKHKHIRSAERVIKDSVSAVSVGVIDGTPMLDLPYIEDSKAMTDMNVAMTGSGEFIEIQGTAEHRPFNRADPIRVWRPRFDAVLNIAIQVQFAQHMHVRLFQRGPLFQNRLMPRFQQFQHVRNVRTLVFFVCEEAFEFIDAHARMFEAGDRLEPPDMRVGVHASPRIVALHVAQQPLILVIAQG